MSFRIVKFAAPALAAAAALAAAGPPAAAQAPGNQAIYGVWKNPKNTVHLDIRPCGERVCGHVVWASAEAQEDARKAGNDLVGLQLLRDFKPAKDGTWRGKVFVPDMNRTFSGAAQPTGPDTLKARGCLIGGVLCKSQTWTRVRS